MTKKIFLKTAGILLLLLTFLNSCRQESILIHEKQTNLNAISFLKLSDLKNEIKNKDVDVIKKISSTSSISSTDKTNLFSNYYILDTLNIKKLNYNNKSTYTFRVYNSQQTANDFYNLVLHNSDGKWVETLLRIKNSNNSNKTIEVIYDSRYGSVETVSTNSASSMKACIGSMEVFEFHCTCPPDWEQCDGCSECVSSHMESFIYDCNDAGSGGGSGIPPSSGGGGGGGGGNGSTTSNPYNNFVFSANENLYLICAEGDSQCMTDVQNLIITSDFFNSLGLNGTLLSSYSDIFFMVKDYLINGNSQDLMEDRINLVGGWMKIQDNSTDEKKLANYKFAHWALNYFVNVNPDGFEYYKNHPLDFDIIRMEGITMDMQIKIPV